MNRRVSGAKAEDDAVRFLTASGYAIVDRNWRRRFGEIDIVAAKQATLVFVEVRSRSTGGFGTAIESITAAKVRRLRMLAAAYTQSLEHRQYTSTLLAIVTVTYDNGAPSCSLTWVD